MHLASAVATEAQPIALKSMLQALAEFLYENMTVCNLITALDVVSFQTIFAKYQKDDSKYAGIILQYCVDIAVMLAFAAKMAEDA